MSEFGGEELHWPAQGESVCPNTFDNMLYFIKANVKIQFVVAITKT